MKPLPLLTYHPLFTSQHPSFIIVFLHGYGADGTDYLSLAQQWRDQLPGAIALAPNGPIKMLTGRSWFLLDDISLEALQHQTSTVYPLLKHFLLFQCKKYSIPLNRTILVGFSQGAMLATYALQSLPSLTACVSYSGLFIPSTSRNHPSQRDKASLFLTHGAQDVIIPLPAFWLSILKAREAGLCVEWHLSQEAAHYIDPIAQEYGLNFIKRHISL